MTFELERSTIVTGIRDIKKKDFVCQIHYRERPVKLTQEHIAFDDGTLVNGNVQPNSKQSRIYTGSRSVQDHVLSWDLRGRPNASANTPSGVVTNYGYLSVQTNDGRINLIASPTGSKVKLRVSTGFEGQNGDGHYVRYKSFKISNCFRLKRICICTYRLTYIRILGICF